MSSFASDKVDSNVSPEKRKVIFCLFVELGVRMRSCHDEVKKNFIHVEIAGFIVSLASLGCVSILPHWLLTFHPETSFLS